MTKAERITKAYGRGYDAERKVLLPNRVLDMVEHIDGEDDVVIARCILGWLPTPGRLAGQVASKLRVDLTSIAILTLDPNGTPVTGVMTTDLAERVHRMHYIDDTVFVVTNFDKPAEAPMLWKFYGEELVLGGLQ